MRKGLAVLSMAYVLMSVAMAQSGPTVKEVVVRGTKLISRDVILTAMSLTEGKPYDDASRLKDERQIKDLGVFKDVKVLSRQLTETDVQVIVEVEENPYIKEIRLVGNTVIPTADLLPLVTQATESVFNTRTVAPTVDAIAKLYEKKGFFAQADVAPLPDSPGTLNVQIIERAVNEIKITGLTRTKRGTISRLLKTKPGEAFNESLWAEDYRRLESTQWFEQITPGSESTDEIGKFNLLLDVKELRTAQFGFGASLDPRNRLAGSLRLFDTNFRGTGQNVSFTIQQDAFGSGTSASLDYSNPYIDNRETSLSVRLYSRVVNYFTGSGLSTNASPDQERFDERRTGASIAVARPFKKVFGASAGVSWEKVKTLSLRNAVTDYIQQDGDLLIFNFGLARDRRDVVLDPAEGDYWRLTVEPGLSNVTKIGGNVGANTDILGRHKFIRTYLEYKQFWSKRPTDSKKLFDPRRVLALRMRAGKIVGTVPFFEQLFMGGSDSLRGYDDQRFWGKTSFLASAEYRFPVQKSFTLIGFADYGGAWGGYGTLNKFIQSSKPDLHLGYGAGVAFRTPLGPIRIDFGFNDKGGSRTHFSIGGSF